MITTTELLGDGLGVAVATPFTRDGRLDEAALARLTQHIVGGGTDLVVALGSTGEAGMLDERERQRVVEIIAGERGAARLVVGTGASSTAQTIANTERARELGADAALVAVPPYTKPTQQGIVAHFRAIADAVPDLALIAYNVPSRTGVNLQPKTMRELWQLPQVLAVKESSGDLLQITRIAADTPDDRALLAGDDGLLLPTIAVGGRGVVSVAGNIVPEAMRELLGHARGSDLVRARDCQATLLPLFEALSLESNPIPIKAALAIAGFAENTLRLPLQPATPATIDAVRQALQTARSMTIHV